jgi:hypothetical protein
MAACKDLLGLYATILVLVSGGLSVLAYVMHVQQSLLVPRTTAHQQYMHTRFHLNCWPLSLTGTSCLDMGALLAACRTYLCMPSAVEMLLVQQERKPWQWPCADIVAPVV